MYREKETHGVVREGEKVEGGKRARERDSRRIDTIVRPDIGATT